MAKNISSSFWHRLGPWKCTRSTTYKRPDLHVTLLSPSSLYWGITWSFWREFYGDPIFFGSGPGFVNPVRSGPGFVNPIRSDPVQVLLTPTISALRSQQLVLNYFLYPCKCLDFHFGEILSQFCPILWQNKHRSRLADIFDGCIANELTWQKSPEGGIWRKELKNGLQLANKNIIPLSKFGKNRQPR